MIYYPNLSKKLFIPAKHCWKLSMYTTKLLNKKQKSDPELLFLDNLLFKNKIERIRLWNILIKSEKFCNHNLIAIPGG